MSFLEQTFKYCIASTGVIYSKKGNASVILRYAHQAREQSGQGQFNRCIGLNCPSPGKLKVQVDWIVREKRERRMLHPSTRSPIAIAPWLGFLQLFGAWR